VYSRVLQPILAAALQILLASCSTYFAAASGISPDEIRVLVSTYYWQPGQKPFTYTAEQLDALLRRSTDPTLDGDTAEGETAALVWALATVGDGIFSQALARQSEAVKRAVARDVSYLWTHFKLHYPKTERVLQPYT